MRAPDLAAVAGITYRQLDHWVRTGRVTCSSPGGSGNPREFTRDEVAVVVYAGTLVQAGVRPDQAIQLGRTLALTGQARLADGLLLTTTDFDSPAPQPMTPQTTQDDQNGSPTR